MARQAGDYPPEFKQQEAIRLVLSSCEEKHPLANHREPAICGLCAQTLRKVGQPQADMLHAAGGE